MGRQNAASLQSTPLEFRGAFFLFICMTSTGLCPKSFWRNAAETEWRAAADAANRTNLNSWDGIRAFIAIAIVGIRLQRLGG